MALHDVLDIATFRLLFPAFISETLYPDATLNLYYGVAGDYISQEDSAVGGLSGHSLDYALNLLTAHLSFLAVKSKSGKMSGVASAVSVDAVSVTLVPPPVKSAFQFWLSQSPYGLELYGFLNFKSAGGWTVGGSPETGAFRKVAGIF